MDKHRKLIFLESEYIQYKYILSDPEIGDKIARFLFEYVSVEAFYKRLLIAERELNGVKLSERDKKRLSVNSGDVERVLRFFEIDYTPELIDRIFGSNDQNYMDCSIKKLRDRLVHKVNDNVLRVILERYDDITADLNLFIRLFDNMK